LIEATFRLVPSDLCSTGPSLTNQSVHRVRAGGDLDRSVSDLAPLLGVVASLPHLGPRHSRPDSLQLRAGSPDRVDDSIVRHPPCVWL
jgi:hypothetical protein